MVFTLRAIMEVLGYPEEYVNKIASDIMKKLSAENGIKIVNEKTSPAEKVKDTIHSSIIEVELKVNDYAGLIHFCYDYLPSSIELLDTDKIAMPSREFTNGLNDLLARLHHYNLTLSNLVSQLEEQKKIQSPEITLNKAQESDDEIDLTKQ